jgi:hypothetical protein
VICGMAKHAFQLSIEEWAEIHELLGSWPPGRLRNILELAEFDDAVADEDCVEMALMALQDLDWRAAGELVLEAVFGDAMTAGVRQNLTDDLEDDRPWE